MSKRERVMDKRECMKCRQLLPVSEFDINYSEEDFEHCKKCSWFCCEKCGKFVDSEFSQIIDVLDDCLVKRLCRSCLNRLLMGYIPIRVRKFVYARDNNRCVICGYQHDLVIDHKTPITRGGTNDVDNLQAMCKTCKGIKYNHDIHENSYKLGYPIISKTGFDIASLTTYMYWLNHMNIETGPLEIPYRFQYIIVEPTTRDIESYENLMMHYRRVYDYHW